MTRISPSLIRASEQYSSSNEAKFRRDVEQAIEDTNQTVSDLAAVAVEGQDVAMRRFQFLLMGAPGG